MQLVWIISLFFAVLIALFAVQNTALVSVSFFGWRLEAVAVSTLVLAAVALGALLTYLLGVARDVKSRVTTRGDRSTIRGQETLIAELRGRVRELERENERYRAARGLGVGGRELGTAASADLIADPAGRPALSSTADPSPASGAAVPARGAEKRGP